MENAVGRLSPRTMGKFHVCDLLKQAICELSDMDRFIRSQKNGPANGGIHFKKREAATCAQQDTFHAKASAQAARRSGIAKERLTLENWKQPIGLNVVILVSIIYCIVVLVIETMPRTSSFVATPFRINLQTASAIELEFLPGIGPKMAERIIEFRKTHILRTPEDLEGVYGIGQQKIRYLHWLVATEDELK